LLGDTEVPYGNQAKLPSMGISSWASLLVHKWDDLPGRGARKLAKEDENMPTMQSVPNHVAYLRGRVRDGLPFLSQ
jgi:hypothetical protein